MIFDTPIFDECTFKLALFIIIIFIFFISRWGIMNLMLWIGEQLITKRKNIIFITNYIKRITWVGFGIYVFFAFIKIFIEGI